MQQAAVADSHSSTSTRLQEIGEQLLAEEAAARAIAAQAAAEAEMQAAALAAAKENRTSRPAACTQHLVMLAPVLGHSCTGNCCCVLTPLSHNSIDLEMFDITCMQRDLLR